MRFKRLFIFLALLLAADCAFAQCPSNIGFELGTLENWVCYTGNFPDATGVTPIVWSAPVAPVPGRHQIIKNSSPQITDPYGNFPINAPNSSRYSVQLGNVDHSSNYPSTIGAFAEKMTYNFVVPTDDYTLVYYYAVVFQNPADHNADQQPQFIANVHNLDNPAEDGGQCGSFSFTASAGLRGFKNSAIDKTVYYKPWSPLTIKISGKKGKHFQVEFITRDCTKGGHFGYAYIDFNEAGCESPITGNQYCAGQNTVTLTAPAGFETYSWTDANGTELSKEATLKISPPPPDGTTYGLHIIPYAGLGCENAFTTTIQQNNEAFNLKVVANAAGCKADGIDLTEPWVTDGSSPGMKFEYYTDPDGQNFISDPKRIVQTGDYYIRGTNAFGCTDIAPIHIDMYDGSTINVTTPPAVCAPATVDLTKTVTSPDAGVTYTYYSDALLKVQLTTAQAKAIDKTGTYYVKAVSFGVPCITIKSVDVVVSPAPVLPVAPITYKSCPPLDLNKAIAAVNTGDNGSVTYKFYTDAAGTIPVDNPATITISGDYYYRAFNEYGCPSAETPLIKAKVVNPPAFTVTDPDPVVYPQTVNLAYTHIPLTEAEFTYWQDAEATKPLDNYQTIGESGTFYIKAENATGCFVINPVHVLVNAPPEANLVAANTFTPNGDGINDDFRPTTEGVITLNFIKIFNRYGQQIFETKQLYNRWNGTLDGKPEPAGTYYWVFSAYDIYRKKIVTKSGSVTIIR